MARLLCRLALKVVGKGMLMHHTKPEGHWFVSPDRVCRLACSSRDCILLCRAAERHGSTQQKGMMTCQVPKYKNTARCAVSCLSAEASSAESQRT